MSVLPRFAVGTIQPEAELCPVLWGLFDVLERVGWHVQSFQSTAQLAPVCGARCITGRSQRHLDSWMMSKATSREIFEHGARAAELAVVEGRFDSGRASHERASLDTLSDWLDLPRIAVVDVQKLGGCRAPLLPRGVNGLFLDRVRDGADGLRWQTWLEAYYGVPVLGYLNRATKLRSLIGAREAGSPCRELCRALGERLEPTLRMDRLVQIAQSKAWTKSADRLFQPQQHDDKIKVAVAFDEAFQGYFADTLDLLEARGADICDFSPLRSEALPWNTDVVYLAGMRNDQYAEALSSNICLKQTLRRFAGQGGRVYAEGAGLAYLCERMILADGRQFPMAGLIPATAAAKVSLEAVPSEVTFGPQVWLGEEGTKMRGYLDRAWEILPEPGLTSFAQEEEHLYDFVGDGRVLGSQLQVDFAGQPHLVASFFRPRLGALLSV
jgi:cobyrinic acid a,c-diamide synthase